MGGRRCGSLSGAQRAAVLTVACAAALWTSLWWANSCTTSTPRLAEAHSVTSSNSLRGPTTAPESGVRSMPPPPSPPPCALPHDSAPRASHQGVDTDGDEQIGQYASVALVLDAMQLTRAPFTPTPRSMFADTHTLSHAHGDTCAEDSTSKDCAALQRSNAQQTSNSESSSGTEVPVYLWRRIAGAPFGELVGARAHILSQHACVGEAQGVRFPMDSTEDANFTEALGGVRVGAGEMSASEAWRTRYPHLAAHGHTRSCVFHNVYFPLWETDGQTAKFIYVAELPADPGTSAASTATRAADLVLALERDLRDVTPSSLSSRSSKFDPPVSSMWKLSRWSIVVVEGELLQQAPPCRCYDTDGSAPPRAPRRSSHPLDVMFSTCKQQPACYGGPVIPRPLILMHPVNSESREALLWHAVMPAHAALQSLGLSNDTDNVQPLLMRMASGSGHALTEMMPAAFGPPFIPADAFPGDTRAQVLAHVRSLVIGSGGRSPWNILPPLSPADSHIQWLWAFRNRLLRVLGVVEDLPNPQRPIRVAFGCTAECAVMTGTLHAIAASLETWLSYVGVAASVSVINPPAQPSLKAWAQAMANLHVLVALDGEWPIYAFFMPAGSVFINAVIDPLGHHSAVETLYLTGLDHVAVMHAGPAIVTVRATTPSVVVEINAAKLGQVVQAIAACWSHEVSTVPVPRYSNHPERWFLASATLHADPALADSAMSLLAVSPELMLAKALSTLSPRADQQLRAAYDTVISASPLHAAVREALLTDAAASAQRQLHVNLKPSPCQTITFGFVAQMKKVPTILAVLDSMRTSHMVQMLVAVWDVTGRRVEYLQRGSAADAGAPCDQQQHPVVLLHVARSSWTESRNELAAAMFAMESSAERRFSHWVFADGDIAGAECTGCPRAAEDPIRATACCMDYMVSEVLQKSYNFALVGNVLGGNTRAMWQQAGSIVSYSFDFDDCIDAMLNAMHRDAVPLMLPYFEDLDDRSWWSSQGILYHIASGCVSGGVVNMARDIMPANLESAPYPRTRDEFLEEAVVQQRLLALKQFPLNTATNPTYLCNRKDGARVLSPDYPNNLPTQPDGWVPAQWLHTPMYNACFAELHPRFLARVGRGLPEAPP